RDENLHALLAKIVKEDLATALKLLEKTSAELNATKLSKDVIRYAHKFFLTDADAIDPKDLNWIKSVVTRIWDGLAGDVTIKAGNDNHRAKDGTRALGSVAKQKGSHSSKSYHTEVPSLGDNEMYTRGAIRIGGDALRQGRLGVVTLIHEASHKYAGTIDYC